MYLKVSQLITLFLLNNLITNNIKTIDIKHGCSKNKKTELIRSISN